MGFFDKLKGAVGIGQPKVDLTLDKKTVSRGESIEATINCTGGARELEMKEAGISIYRVQKYKDANGNSKRDRKRIYRDTTDLGGELLKEGDTKTWKFTADIPADLTRTGGEISYQVVGFLDVPGMDPENKEELVII